MTTHERLVSICAVVNYVEHQFTRFKSLPTEVRRLIWKYAMPQGRILRHGDVRRCNRSLHKVTRQQFDRWNATKNTAALACDARRTHIDAQSQLEYWDFSSSHPRPSEPTTEEHVCAYTERYSRSLDHLVSPLLVTCRESRQVMTTHYKLMLGSQHGLAKVRFDPARDTLYLPTKRYVPLKTLDEDCRNGNEFFMLYAEQDNVDELSQSDKDKVKFLALQCGHDSALNDITKYSGYLANLIRNFPNLKRLQLVIQDFSGGHVADSGDIQRMKTSRHLQLWKPVYDVKAVLRFVEKHLDEPRYMKETETFEQQCQEDAEWLQKDLKAIFRKNYFHPFDDWVAKPNFVVPDIELVIFVSQRIQCDWERDYAGRRQVLTDEAWKALVIAP